MTPPAPPPPERLESPLNRPQTFPPFPKKDKPRKLEFLQAEYDRLVRQITLQTDELCRIEKYKNKLTNTVPQEARLLELEAEKMIIFKKLVKLRQRHFPTQSCNPLRVSTPDEMPPGPISPKPKSIKNKKD